MPSRTDNAAVYVALPVALVASRASQSTSRVVRKPSAVAVPIALKLRSCGIAPPPAPAPPKRPLPSMRVSPPINRACTPASEKPPSVKFKAPRTCVKAGASGTSCSSLSVSAMLACTLALSTAASGRSSLSRYSALPVARTLAIGSPSGPASGAPACSSSASGPRAWASTFSSAAGCAMSAICASAFSISMPGAPTIWPRALRTSMPARSNTSSPESRLSAGQTTAGDTPRVSAPVDVASCGGT